MAETIFELLAPHIDDAQSHSPGPVPSVGAQSTNAYIARLTTLQLQSLTAGEADAIKQASQSTLRSLQDLSKRSYPSIIAATNHLDKLAEQIPKLRSCSQALESALPDVDLAAQSFASKYERSRESSVLDRRKRYMQLNSNIDRIANVLELPALLASIVSSSSATAAAGTTGSMTYGYASALDIHAQVKRLATLYPNSRLVQEISTQSGEEIRNLVTLLISSLDMPGLKLAAAMRAIGWLRRVAPDLAKHEQDGHGMSRHVPEAANLEGGDSSDDSLGALFLVRRLGTMRRTIDALDPLKALADAETERRLSASTSTTDRPHGTQSERYIKKYIEIFREHSFAIISTYKSIFTPSMPASTSESNLDAATSPDTHNGSPAKSGNMDQTERQQTVLATFVPFISDLLFDMLRTYMPNITESAARESLLTQVLYCAASLGRPGADFSMMLALMEGELGGVASDSPGVSRDLEWVKVQKKHRAQASRLELLAGGSVGGANGHDGTKSKVAQGVQAEA